MCRFAELEWLVEDIYHVRQLIKIFTPFERGPKTVRQLNNTHKAM